jgi:spermidine/putrescine transport system permease protein
MNRVRSRRSTQSVLGLAVVVLVLALLFLPIILIVLFSFNSTARLSFPITGLSLRWYRAAWEQQGFVDAMTNSAMAAIFTALIAGSAGLMAALGAQKLSPKRRLMVERAFESPNLMPPLIIGAGLALVLQLLRLRQSLATIVAGHVMVATPFVFASLRAKVATFDFSVIEAARDLGATSFSALSTVLIPLLRAPLVSATMIAAALSIDEFIVTTFTHGATETVPTLTFGLLRQGVDPTVNALATMILVSTGLLVWVGMASARSES